LGINRFSTIKFFKIEKALPHSSFFKAESQVKIKYGEYMSQLAYKVKDPDNPQGKSELLQNS